MREINIGDRVKITLNTEVDAIVSAVLNNGSVECYWLDKNNTLNKEVFTQSVLEFYNLIDEDKREDRIDDLEEKLKNRNRNR